MSALDLSDPWRYTCPHCGASFDGRIERRVGHPLKMKETPDKRPHGQTTKEVDMSHGPYYCQGCKQGLTKLYDKKHDTNVHVGKRYAKYADATEVNA